MRNLKRALSLALAVVMVIGLMVVGASAVSYNDFSDRGEIVNKDAVSMLTTLGIIEGQPDGSYNPAGNVDRAQMAKMISVALTNNEDCDTLYTNVNSGLTDITANWARGYINYCYVRGIIAGRGDNTFDPSANVTGVEAAKMLLAALGYNAEIEGLVGPDWALNTAALAQQLGIFRNFTKDVSEPLSRDDAALLIYNALDVEMIQQYSNGYALVYADHRTILSSVFGVVRVEGVVTANEWARLEETDSDAALRTGKTTLDEVVVYDSTTSNTTVPEGVKEDDPVTFNVTTPVEYIGKAVTMYVEKTTILANSNVIGVATNDEANVIHATTATEETLKDLLDGTGIETDKNTDYYVNYGWCEDGASEAVSLINAFPNKQLDEKNGYYSVNGVDVEVIDNNDDGTAEYVLYTVETLSEVNRYSEKNETITFYAAELDRNGTPTTSTVTRDFDDVVFNDEVGNDDLILYVEYGGRTYVKLAEIVTDMMNRVDRDKDNELYITLDNGEEYRQSYIPDAAAMVDVDLTHFDIDDAKADIGFDTLYDFILDSAGYVVAVRPAEEVVTNYALVLNSAWTMNALTRGGEVKILKADGTEATYDINWDKSADAFEDVISINGSKTTSGGSKVEDLSNDSKLELYLGTRDVEHDGDYSTSAAAGSIITYSLNDDGDVLTIKSVLQGNTFEAKKSSEIAKDVNEETTAGVGDDKTVIYMDNPGSDYETGSSNTRNLQYELADDYTNRDGNIQVTANNDKTPKNYAVDLDTVAFYYDVVTLEDLLPKDKVSNKFDVGDIVAGHTITKADRQAKVVGNGKYADTNYDVGDVLYGVATGWDDMSDVASGTEAQVYPVLEKTDSHEYTATNLADVILFNTAIETDSNDYMLVLDANAAARGDIWYLTVVFEDGTVDEITVDDDDLGDLDPERKADFMKAYTYSENADGTYKVGDEGKYTGTAVNLSNHTVDFESPVDTHTYISLATQGNVWDVTDVEHEGDEAVASAFSKTEVNAVLVIDNGQIRTAWIWDIPQSVTPDDPEDRELTVTITTDADRNGVIIVDDPNNSSPTVIARAIAAELEDEGYDSWEFDNVGEGSKVTAVDGSLKLGFTIHYAMASTEDLSDVLSNIGASSDPIYLGVGEYELDATAVTNNVTIIGIPGETTITTSKTSDNAWGIRLAKDNIKVTISGVDFVNDPANPCTIAIKDTGNATLADGFEVKIDNCTFTGYGWGIQIFNGGDSSVTNCEFKCTNYDISVGSDTTGTMTGKMTVSGNVYSGNQYDIEAFTKGSSQTIDDILINKDNATVNCQAYPGT